MRRRHKASAESRNGVEEIMASFFSGRSKVAGLITASVLVLSACSSSTATTAPTAAAGGKTVGIVAFDSTSPIDKIFADAAKAKLDKDGYKTLMQDPKGDPGQANTICTQYVTAKVDAILVVTFALDQMATCMSGATAASIPVFFEGTPLLAGMSGAINVAAPKPINDVFIKYVVDNKVTDSLALDYSPGTPCRMRAEYRETVLAAQAPSVKETKHEFPIPGQVVDAQNTTAAWLAAHPAGSGKFAIWSCFADPTTGALAAMAQVNRTDVVIYTWDYNTALLAAIRSGLVAGDLYLDGKAVGEQHAQLAEDWFGGNHTPQDLTAANVILTKDNIEQFLKDHPEAAPSAA
jgi:ABC-type sugar transport system substrate-binding protein